MSRSPVPVSSVGSDRMILRRRLVVVASVLSAFAVLSFAVLAGAARSAHVTIVHVTIKWAPNVETPGKITFAPATVKAGSTVTLEESRMPIRRTTTSWNQRASHEVHPLRTHRHTQERRVQDPRPLRRLVPRQRPRLRRRLARQIGIGLPLLEHAPKAQSATAAACSAVSSLVAPALSVSTWTVSGLNAFGSCALSGR